MSNVISPSTTPAGPLIHLLRQLAEVILRLEDYDYSVECARGVSGSIGAHVRHCLEHVSALVAGAQAGHVSYDSRRRGTAVELRREAAVTEIERLQDRLATISSNTLAQPVAVPCALDARGSALIAKSTVARELAFVISHTIHHFAVIALLLRDLGISVPPRFGYAPTTPPPAVETKCA
jgi:uncharacterized damage-inducible protein DinB